MKEETQICPRCNTEKPSKEIFDHGDYVCKACRKETSGTVSIPVIDITRRVVGIVHRYYAYVNTFSLEMTMQDDEKRENIVYGSSKWLCRNTPENLNRLSELAILDLQMDLLREKMVAKEKEMTDYINTSTFREINDAKET